MNWKHLQISAVPIRDLIDNILRSLTLKRGVAELARSEIDCEAMFPHQFRVEVVIDPNRFRAEAFQQRQKRLIFVNLIVMCGVKWELVINNLNIDHCDTINFIDHHIGF